MLIIADIIRFDNREKQLFANYFIEKLEKSLPNRHFGP